MPKLSIIVPVYNVEKYVEKCLDSIVNQTLVDIEIIIVNDGSMDTSIDICNRFKEIDNRIKIINKKNGGLMSAWKEGVRNASSDIIGFVDSDDWIEKDMFSTLVTAIEEFGADIVCSGYIMEGYNNTKAIGRDKLYQYSGDEIREFFVKEYCCSYLKSESNPTICRWDKVYKKELLIKNFKFFNEKVSMGEDFNTNIAVFLDAQKVVLLPNFTPYHYRYNPSSIVNSVNPKAFDNILELSNICNAICENKNQDSFYIDSFIGNMIYEEVCRICRNQKITKKISMGLNHTLGICNADYYLKMYKKVRHKKKINLMCSLILTHKYKLISTIFRLYGKLH